MTTRTVEGLCDGEVVACYALTFFGCPKDAIWIREAQHEANLDPDVPPMIGEFTYRLRDVREGDVEA